MIQQFVKLSDAELLSVFDGMYSGDKDPGDIRNLTVKVVRTRKPQQCPGLAAGKQHDVPAGSRMVREHALVEGAWHSCYTCEDCVLWWAQESGQLSTLRNVEDTK